MKTSARKTAKKRHLTPKQRKQRRIRVAISVVVLILVLPVLLAAVLWWRGLLPTREEMPRYKEWLVLMFTNWKHTRLPEAEVIGIDISHYQGGINFDELCFHLDASRRMYSSQQKDTKPRQVDFLIAKATQGSRMQDNYYNSNKQGCREKGILFGAYHFYSLKSGAKAQADNFIQYAGLQKGDLVPVLDVEPADGKLPERDSVLQWLQIVSKYYDVKPMIYTNEKTYTNYFLKSDKFKRYPFWIARYGGKEPSKHHAMWQCAESGRAGGVTGPVDVDIFRGTKSDLGLYVIK